MSFAKLLLQVVVYALSALASWLLVRWLYRRQKYDLHRIPGPPGLPLLGNVLTLFKNVYSIPQMIHQWDMQYGQKGVFKWHLGPKAILVVTDPTEFARLSGASLNLPKDPMIYAQIEPGAPKHYSLLATPDYQYWKHVRKNLNVAFSPDNIRKIYHTVYEKTLAAADAVGKLAALGPIDVDDAMQRVTGDVISAAGYEDETLNLLETEQSPEGKLRFKQNWYLEAVRASLDSAAQMFINPLQALKRHFSSSNETSHQKSWQDLLDKHNGRIMRNIHAKGPQPEDNTTLWACLSRLKDYQTGGPMCDIELNLNIGIVFAAGFETTAHATSFALMEAAANPDIQDKLVAELTEAGLIATKSNPNPRPLEYADLGRLKYLNLFVRETMRLHPTAPMGSGRVTDKDVMICGYRVPKGTAVSLAAYPVHRSPRNFIDPDRLWPERFAAAANDHVSNPEYPDATPAGNRRDPSNSWVTFSTGPKNCVGQTLALMELKCLVAVFLSRYVVKLPSAAADNSYSNREIFKITLQPDELYLDFVPRVPA